MKTFLKFLILGLLAILVLGGIWSVSHPPEDCNKPVSDTAKKAKKNHNQNSEEALIRGFQNRQLLKSTGKWDKGTLSSCKSICLKLGEMEE